MSHFDVALLQMVAPGNDPAENASKAIDWCRRAATMGADLALLPEIWSCGYTNGFEIESDDIASEWRQQSISETDEYVIRFRNLARDTGMAIGLTLLERWEPAPRNTILVIDRHGDTILRYAKVHTCDFFPMEASCTPGDGFHVATLDTSSGPVELGAMICYDREHPESARILMLKGAEIVLTPNACTLQSLRIGQFRARAWENAMGVAMTNYAAGHPYCNGHSVAFDAEGNLLVQAGADEGIFLARFDLDALRSYRERTFFGNAFRRPHKYELLESAGSAAPFAIRTDGNGERWQQTSR